jgi:NADPH:quinone reductase-like Zn-dependent oxidoreductase
MKAIFFDSHGDLSNVRYGDVPEPEIGSDDILLDVKAAALNRLDLWVLAGWPGLNLHLPHVMGSDGAGIVAAVGANVSNVAVGDRVAVDPTIGCGQCRYCQTARAHMCDRFAILGEHLPGFYADRIKIPSQNAVPLPAHVSFEDAAAASLVFVTAWHSLIKRGRLQAGEDVLIVGAGGGVNTASIQIAKLAGARRIYVVGSADAKLAQAEALGADVLINRNEENWGKAVFKASDKLGVDIVVDNVGAATFKASLRALKKGGRLVTVGNTSGPVFEFDNRLMFARHLEIIGSTMGSHADYIEVMELVFAGRLQPIIDTVYPLSAGLTALERMQDGDVMGKLILTPGA